MRLGIFGGSFDPVHNGHVALARACQQQAALDEVWFVPTAVQPLKRLGPHATATQRLEMLELAIGAQASEPGRPRPWQKWRICTLEVDRGGVSYTIETLRQLHKELPGDKLFFLIGSDSLRDVARWKESREIFSLATPLVVQRANEPPTDLTLLSSLCSETKQPQLIEMPAAAISSTDIRQRAAAGKPIDEFVPPVVARYVAQHGVYNR